jgi:hypothetical protein
MSLKLCPFPVSQILHQVSYVTSASLAVQDIQDKFNFEPDELGL